MGQQIQKKFILILSGLAIFLNSALSATIPVRSASEFDYPPYCTVKKDGEADGFSVELLKATLQVMGRDVSFRVGQWSEIKESLAKGEIQVLPLVGRTPEREKLYDFTFPYLSMHGTIVVREGTQGIRNIDDLKKKRVAVLKGDNAEEYLKRIKLDAQFTATSTFEEALRQLSEGKQDAVVMQRLLFSQLIKKTKINNLVTVGAPLKDFVQKFCFAVRKGDKDLLATLNEGLSIVMSDGTFQKLYGKWFGALDTQEFAKRILTVGGDRDYSPYEYLDENGKPAGFNVELTRAIAKEEGILVDIQLDTWSKVKDRLKKGEIDLVQGMFYSKERDAEFDFSQTYTRVPHVIVTRRGDPEIKDWEELRGKKILVMAGDIAHDFALKGGLKDELLLVPSQEVALSELNAGKADLAFVAKLPALYWIKQHKWDHLDVGEIPFLTPDYSFASLEGSGSIVAMFSDGLSVLEKTGEYRKIRDKWFSPYDSTKERLEKFISYIVWLGGFLGVLLLVIIGWTYSLRKQVKSATQNLKKGEELLRQQKRLLTSVIEGANDAIFAKDLEGRYLLANSEVARIVNKPLDQIIGFDDRNIFPDKEAQELIVRDKKIIETESRVVEEELLTTSNGNRIFLASKGPFYDGNGKVCGVFGVSRDITDRKRLEGRITESEKRYRDLFESMVDAFALHEMILDSNGKPCDYRFLAVNSAFEQFTGLRGESIVGKRAREVIPNLEEKWVNVYGQVVLTGESVHFEDYDQSLKRHYEIVAYRPAEGQFACVFKDVTESKQIRERLHQSEKMDAIGQMAGGIAHDFNNQLTTVMGNLGLLMERLDNKGLLEIAESILKASRRAADLTKQLLAFSRKGKYISKKLDIHSTVSEVVTLLKHSIDKKIALKQILAANSSTIVGDPSLLQNAILNLALNARDAMPEGGELVFSTADVEFKDAKENKADLQGKFVEIAVTDSGMGMTEEVKRHIFEPFFTTKEQGKGTGLGLASVFGTVKMHEGAILCESEVGKGTTFKIYLPVCEDQILEASLEASNEELKVGEPPKPKKDFHILLVDDEELICEFVEKALKKVGYRVTSFSDPLRALEYYKQAAGDVHLAILDMAMPNLSGRELFLGMRKVNPNLKALLSSGYSVTGEVQRVLDEGMVGFIQKPYEMRLLKSTVANTLETLG